LLELMDNLKNVAVLGAGSWGTSITKILMHNRLKKSSKIDSLAWWVLFEEQAEHIRVNKHNPDYMSSVEFDTNVVEVSSDMKSIVKKADILVLVIPSAFLKQSLEAINKEDLKGKYIVTAIKGLLPHNKKIVTDFLHIEYEIPYDMMMVISGPCHAEEVASEKLSYLTIAGHNDEVVAHFASMLQCDFIRTVLSRDIDGTEYGAVLKNIYAVASGICHGLGFGDNFQAALVSNAIIEMEAFLTRIDPQKREVNHSAYLGDLLVTAYSKHSRNRTFGNFLGQGYSAKVAQLEMNMIAEGYYASKSFYELSKEIGVEMPIAEAVYNIVHNNKPAKKEIMILSEKLI